MSSLISTSSPAVVSRRGTAVSQSMTARHGVRC